ncbi:MAG: hypothetical protein AAFR75_06780 [Pseudomonadota bacterium]
MAESEADDGLPDDGPALAALDVVEVDPVDFAPGTGDTLAAADLVP